MSTSPAPQTEFELEFDESVSFSKFLLSDEELIPSVVGAVTHSLMIGHEPNKVTVDEKQVVANLRYFTARLVTDRLTAFGIQDQYITTLAYRGLAVVDFDELADKAIKMVAANHRDALHQRIAKLQSVHGSKQS